MEALINKRKREIIDYHYQTPWPSPENESLASRNTARLGWAYASYLSGDGDTGNSMMGEVYRSGFPDFDGYVYEWDGEFVLPVFMRMYVVNESLHDLMTEEVRQHFLEMILKYLQMASDLDQAGSGPWTSLGTENHTMMRKVSCLLGSYALSREDSFKDAEISSGTSPAQHYKAWLDHLQQWIIVRAQTGLHDEIHSPQYEKYTLSSLYNLADFPGDPTIRALAQNYIRLFWHDVAHDFNSKTGTQGGAGTRMYQPGPSGEGGATSYYVRPNANWKTRWLYMYAWHDHDPGRRTHPNILVPADSGLHPLKISFDLATSPSKRIEYASRRPGKEGVSAGDQHYIRRDVSVNEDYVMGAVTYDPSHEYIKSSVEAIWYAVTINNNSTDRILLSGSANEKKPGSGVYADWNAINGTAYKDVIIAARSNLAENSRGMKVYLGEGALRDHLEVDDPSDWIFTRAGNAYVAIRIPDPGLDFFKEDGQVTTLRLDGGEDVWVPIVIQMAQAKNFSNFNVFKQRVRSQPYQYTEGEVEYTSLRNYRYSMRRQKESASLPKINGRDRNTTPTYTYQSPYIYMAWGSSTAYLYGPDGTALALGFSL